MILTPKFQRASNEKIAHSLHAPIPCAMYSLVLLAYWRRFPIDSQHDADSIIMILFDLEDMVNDNQIKCRSLYLSLYPNRALS